MIFRTYTELIKYKTLEDRFNYLKLSGSVGAKTFGFDRYLNQAFYTSKEWRDIRSHIITRDGGCDLGVPDHEIAGNIIIHHMNPITADDFKENLDYILDPEFLISVSLNTHNAIHYGDARLLPKPFVERFPNDTCPWKH